MTPEDLKLELLPIVNDKRLTRKQRECRLIEVMMKWHDDQQEVMLRIWNTTMAELLNRPHHYYN